jgi:argininosuccinate synthase
MTQKGILAFSGGLDTSVDDMDVITVTVDVGQGDNPKKIEAKAKMLGVKKHYNIDAKKEFAEKFIFPSIKANALYQKKYCLATHQLETRTWIEKRN